MCFNVIYFFVVKLGFLNLFQDMALFEDLKKAMHTHILTCMYIYELHVSIHICVKMHTLIYKIVC